VTRSPIKKAIDLLHGYERLSLRKTLVNERLVDGEAAPGHRPSASPVSIGLAPTFLDENGRLRLTFLLV
jgi:hypothetical protein